MATPISLTNLGVQYSQNFDTLSNVAGSTTNSLTITGWILTETGGGVRDNEQYAVDNGTSVTGDTYSYGAAAATDRALGSLQSGALIPVFGAAFANDTGSTINTLSISYVGEEWRLGTAGRSDQLNFEYSIDATDLTTGTYTGVTALNFVTPDTAVAGAKDGNATGERTALSSTITGLNIAPGATFFIRWTDPDASSNDDGLAVDDFALTPLGSSGPPVFVDLDNNPTFTENSSAVLLDSDATVSDADLAPTDPIDGATLTLQRVGGASPDDFINGNFDEGQVISQTSGLVVGFAVIADGVLTVTFNSDAVFADVNDVLQQLTYSNASDAPPPSVVIGYTFNNGDTATGSITVTINQVNDRPSIDALAGSALYQPGSGGAILSPNVALSDFDSPLLSGAVVAFSGGFLGTDVLSADVGSTGIVANYAGGVLTLSASSGATVAQFRQVLQTVTYSSTAADPTNGGAALDRTLNWFVTDSATPPADSPTLTTTLNFGPAVDLDASAAGIGFATTFTQGGAAVAIADTDADITASFQVVSALSVILTNAKAGDVLAATGGPLTVTVDNSQPGRITLLITGSGSETDYENALKSVTFSSSSSNIDPTTRDLSVVASDFNSNPSLAAHSTITIVGAVNDPGSATDDTATAVQNTGIIVPPPGVLANDNDPDGLVVITGAATTSGGGSIQFQPDGSYSYTPATNFSGTDTVVYTAEDPFGSQVTATLRISVLVNHPGSAADDTATTLVNTNLSVPAPGVLANDSDADGLVVVTGAATTSGGGNIQFAADGSYSYTPAANFSGTDTIVYTAQDQFGSQVSATLRINVAVNHPGSAADDTAATSFNTALAGAAPGVLANDNDPDGLVVVTGAVATSGDGAIQFQPNGSYAYTPAANFSGTDTVVYTAQDPFGSQVSATLRINVANPIGTSGDDSFVGTGNKQIDAGLGTDTITFNFRLVDATVTYLGNKIVIDGPSTHAVLSGFEVFNFTDGTVNNKDADPLVDDLFYYAKYHDVWTAHVDADAHFHSSGWKEGRDPDAFFSTAVYLSANPDVKALGVDPLTHFDSTGWKQGRASSITFDPAAYLAANPDVAAANIDPLRHYLANGYQEGRQPIAPTELLAPNGFDYVYYLNHNPDVAASGADPLQHFQTVGWKEGRNPNALFDTSGYLNTYLDVKAANVNPLDHYNQFGWKEGRDPSIGFDTTSYLAAYNDVNAAHINPLTHFLDFGIHEGRSPFADGIWG